MVDVPNLSRLDWLVLFMGLPGGPYPNDQIRIMKGMFLVAKEGPPPARDLYSFTPYDYGPFDTQVYHDLDALRAEGVIDFETGIGTSQRLYRLTLQGEKKFVSLQALLPDALAEDLRRIKLRVTSKSFLELLRDIYGQYPSFASRSVARL